MLDIMLMALAQAAVSAPAQSTAPAPSPNVDVVGPVQPRRRMVCRTMMSSNSHIPAGRVCRTQEEYESAVDRAQREAGLDVRSTESRTADMLVRSQPFQSRPSETSVAQTRRGGN